MKGWKRVLRPVQHMFPNCQVKYKTKCKDMKSCDKDIPEKIIFPEEFLDPVDVKITKPPKGFEDDIERAKKVKFE